MSLSELAYEISKVENIEDLRTLYRENPKHRDELEPDFMDRRLVIESAINNQPIKHKQNGTSLNNK
ncbi:MAG: hypothetical protein HOK72_11475 [Flavobacteriales bacterium]|nr:hypothetical protein [Flavobacteriales bacterium]